MPRIGEKIKVAKRSAVPSEVLPTLALRDTVHFPGQINTLHVVREPSVRAVRKALESDGRVLVFSQRDMAVEEPQAADLHDVGLQSEILQSIPMPDGGLRVALRGLMRVRSQRLRMDRGSFVASFIPITEDARAGAEVDALERACVDTFSNVIALNREIPPEALHGIAAIEDPGLLADTILHHLPLRASQKQELLEELDPVHRLDRTFRALKHEEQILELDAQIKRRVEQELGDGQREYYLREQLRIIQQELQEREDRVGETEEYKERILDAKMPEEALVRAMTELRRLDRSPPASPEGMVVRNYLDILVELPWSALTEDRLDVAQAAAHLDEQHFGLGRVKDRILDYLAVRQLKGTMRGPILCFLGPPGVGKTSIGRSIAEAMGREFISISLGGVRDEADIRGHRRTYVGSMPGRIINGLRDCGSRNPVIVLDEIDKLARDGQGDPTSALLEALDAEQNERFTDHYVEAPFDLSPVLFIATANLIENIPPALRDRMEVIEFASYTDAERLEIARRFLQPKAVDEHGLTFEQIEITDDALKSLVLEYTREAGVRSLHRQITAVCRKAARQIAEHRRETVVVTPAVLQEFLGRPRYKRSEQQLRDEIGVACGLVVGEAGGEVLPIEVSLMPPVSDRIELRLTGNLGEVMKESAYAALTYVRAHVESVAPGASMKMDVHVHIPEGAIPKDGPSAGLTTTIALISAFAQRPVKGSVAFTGEITLRGRVLAVGGIREKLLAAVRAGLSAVVLPVENRPDLEDVPREALEQIEVHFVSEIREALTFAFGT
ncbi:MAG TPA: endopeptidase La [Fimbriimonas sp.]|nr:endopeptidase La [Fimbriimonas sp.]